MLRLATIGVGLEALALLAFSVWLGLESVVRTPDNADVAHASTAYFALIGGLVAIVAAGLVRGWSWAVGAGLFLQLLALPMAWYMARAGLWVGAMPLALVALVSLAGLVSERSQGG